LFATVIREFVFRELDASSGHQDHTASPSASGVLVFSAIRVPRISSQRP
jgi:hypothetical protein